jgi:hypothetical protein
VEFLSRTLWSLWRASSGTSPANDVDVNHAPEGEQKYWEHLANPVVRNVDNELLGAIRLRGLTIGCVEEVNGRGAEEVRNFVPTRHELIQLVKYWAKIGIDIDYFWFCYQQTGSTEMRRGPYAWRRVKRIADILGVEVVKEAIDEACEEYGKDQDPRAWNIFLNGTSEERRVLQDEIAQKICGDNLSQQDSGSPDCNADPAEGSEKAA